MTRLTGIVCRAFVCIACVFNIFTAIVFADTRQEPDGNSGNLLRLEKTNSCPGCDLSGLNLNRMDLKGADLQGADLRNTKLHLVNLAGANLKESLLEGAVMVGADLAGADLRGARIDERSLDGAYLAGALLDEPSLDFAQEDGGADQKRGGEVYGGAQADALVTVRSEGEVIMVQSQVEAPAPKKLSPFKAANLDENLEEPAEPGEEAM